MGDGLLSQTRFKSNKIYYFRHNQYIIYKYIIDNYNTFFKPSNLDSTLINVIKPTAVIKNMLINDELNKTVIRIKQ